MSDWQLIPTHTWTRLHGHDVDVWHEAGHNVPVRVTDLGNLEHEPDVTFRLRPPEGIYRDGWVAPVAGWYQLGSDVGELNAGTTTTWTTITFDTEPIPCVTCGTSTPDAMYCDDCGKTICLNCQPMHPCHDRPRGPIYKGTAPGDFTIEVTNDAEGTTRSSPSPGETTTACR